MKPKITPPRLKNTGACGKAPTGLCIFNLCTKPLNESRSVLAGIQIGDYERVQSNIFVLADNYILSHEMRIAFRILMKAYTLLGRSLSETESTGYHAKF